MQITTVGAKALFENVSQVTNQDTPIVLDGVLCRDGTEQRLDQCDHYPTVEFCSHSFDVGAFCTSNTVTAPESTTTTTSSQSRTSGANNEKQSVFAIFLMYSLVLKTALEL